MIASLAISIALTAILWRKWDWITTLPMDRQLRQLIEEEQNKQ